MVKSCLVATCKNTIGKSEFTFHKIGKKKYENRLKAIGRSPDECLSFHNVICSMHYAEEDFIHFNGKKYLRVEAVPRFFLPRKPQKTVETVPEPPSTLDVPAKPPVDEILNIPTEDDIWLMCTDILMLISQDNNISKMPIQEDLLTDEFFMSSIPLSEACKNFKSSSLEP